ncbi:MAG: anthranilate synthase component I [Planctomycetes bacterium]|nr:anthranilate synthase component I [Planctomycetota bacterium]
MTHYYPDFDQFLKLSREGNTIPVYRQLLADTLTPVTAYQRLAHPRGFAPSSHSFLLESAELGKRARYSFVAADPLVVFTARGTDISIARGGKTDSRKVENPLAELSKLLDGYKPVHLSNLPIFTGGLVGYAGYDIVRYAENLPSAPPDDRNVPDMLFGLYRTVVVFDHLYNTIKVVHNAHVEDDPGKAYSVAQEAIDRAIARLREGGDQSVTEIGLGKLPQKPFESNFTVGRFEQAVEKCKDYIRAGDIFQVVLSQRLTVNTTVEAFDIYRALRVINPSPYMFLLKGADVTLVGASPEIMCRVEGGVITNRPLAGTRPRGATEEEDKALEQELLADPKERAEHIMLVDLARNDVGRVSKPNTVKLHDMMSVERYSHVMHIVSDVKGELADGMNAFDAMRAALPVGTVSGAPKIRAMQIIDELEPTRRGPYAGAVGYVDFSGNMDTCIALRTMVVTGKKVYIQVGAGIVADSVPQNEHQETLNKARALLRAIEVAEAGFARDKR